jgi:hypothetical protein
MPATTSKEESWLMSWLTVRHNFNERRADRTNGADATHVARRAEGGQKGRGHVRHDWQSALCGSMQETLSGRTQGDMPLRSWPGPPGHVMPSSCTRGPRDVGGEGTRTEICFASGVPWPAETTRTWQPGIRKVTIGRQRFKYREYPDRQSRTYSVSKNGIRAG